MTGTPKSDSAKADEDMEQQELLFNTSENKKWYIQFGKQLESFLQC